MLGIGYQEAKQKRINEGFARGKIEKRGNEEYLLYFARAHIVDHETGLEARGLLKIGRGKFKTALQRGRNQPGVDFRIYAEVLVESNADTYHIEDIVKRILSNKNIQGSQGQRELYDISDDELYEVVNNISSYAIKEGVKVLNTNFYLDTLKAKAA